MSMNLNGIYVGGSHFHSSPVFVSDISVLSAQPSLLCAGPILVSTLFPHGSLVGDSSARNIDDSCVSYYPGLNRQFNFFPGHDAYRLYVSVLKSSTDDLFLVNARPYVP